MKKIMAIFSLLLTTSVFAQFGPIILPKDKAEHEKAEKECLEKVSKNKDGHPDKTEFEKCLESKGIKKK